MTEDSIDVPTCSRAGCRNDATTTVNWRNPRIHALDRVKVWHACDEHAQYLHDYLATRDFPVLLAPLGMLVSVVPSLSASPSSLAPSSSSVIR